MNKGRIRRAADKAVPIIVTLGLVAGGLLSGQRIADGSRRSLETLAGVSEPRPTVVLDPGHGGMDGGCVSVNDIPEKGINLSIALTERDLLTVMGYEVTMTREDDRSIHDDDSVSLSQQKLSDMRNRLEIIDRDPTGIAVSIHQNQFTDSRYSGAQMFYSERNAQGAKLAETLRSQFRSLLQPDNERETKPVGDELFLLDKSDKPVVMAECGFLSNPEEAALLETPAYQRQVAFTIMTGILLYGAGS